MRRDNSVSSSALIVPDVDSATALFPQFAFAAHALHHCELARSPPVVLRRVRQAAVPVAQARRWSMASRRVVALLHSGSFGVHRGRE